MPETQPTTNERSTEALMSEYVSIVNLAMDKHAGDFPFKQILDALERIVHNKERIGVAVYTTAPQSPHDYFTLRYNDARRLELAARGKQEPDIEWKVKRGYLEEVARDRQAYIDNPMKLDWDWIKSRLSDALPS